jgi:hypothetical protein
LEYALQEENRRCSEIGTNRCDKALRAHQRLRLVMRLLLELKNRSLVGPEWQLYILSWTAETVAEDLQGLARPSSHFSNRRLSRCKVSVYCP